MGNTCRSPFAEYYAQQHYGQHHRFSSWGLRTMAGSVSSDAAIAAAWQGWQIDLCNHASKPLQAADLNGIDRFLCMTNQIRQILQTEFEVPQSSNLLLAPYDIADPYGGDVETYTRIYRAIAGNIDELFVNFAPF